MCWKPLKKTTEETAAPRPGDQTGPETADLFESVLGRGLRLCFHVTGASMAPLIRSGDAVVVERVGACNLKPGDLILFVNRLGSPVLHRVLRIARDATGGALLRTKGDAQGMFDEPVEPSAVLGRVVRIERSGHGLLGRSIDLDSPPWRRVGPLLARVHVGVNRLWSVAMRLQGRK